MRDAADDGAHGGGAVEETTVTLPPVTPRWRRRLGRWLYGRVRWVYPQMCAHHDLTDRGLTAAHRELKQAWRKLDEKGEEIRKLRREVWNLGHPYGGTESV